MTKKKTATRAGKPVTRPSARATAPAVLAWGGFVEGQLDCGWRLGDRHDISPIYSVFKTRAFARSRFADVRRVEIREKA